MRLLMSPLSPGERTDTGTIARSVRPFVGSPLLSSRTWTPPATAVRTTSFTVPPSRSLMVRNTSNGRSAVAKRRLGPTFPSNGPRGGVPMPATVRRASAVATDGFGEYPRLPRHVREALERMEDHLLHRVADQVLHGGAGSAVQTASGAPSGASGARSNSADAIIIPPMPSAIA